MPSPRTTRLSITRAGMPIDIPDDVFAEWFLMSERAMEAAIAECEEA